MFEEYIPLILPSPTIICSEEDPETNVCYSLNYADFNWRVIETPDRKFSKYFENGELLEFEGWSKYEGPELELKGASLRLPNVVSLSKETGLVLSDVAAEGLLFAKQLATIQGEALLTDTLGQQRSGFRYLIFPKPLSSQRALVRYSKFSAAQRPLICISVRGHDETIFVHREQAEKWLALGIRDFMQTPLETGFDIRAYEAEKKSYRNYEHVFESIDDWQNNQFKLDEY